MAKDFRALDSTKSAFGHDSQPVGLDPFEVKQPVHRSLPSDILPIKYLEYDSSQ